MAERLGLAIIPGTGWRASDIEIVAREAEDAGFDAIFSVEVNNDAMAAAQLMGMATRRIKVGTFVANIYMRSHYTCAKGAALIADATEGRMVLGLGVSHRSINEALGLEMPSPATALRDYVTRVRNWLRGEGPATPLPQQPSVYPVPIHIAALTSPGMELAGELCDGVMPFLWSADRVAKSKTWAARGRAKAVGLGSLEISLGLPIFIGGNLERLRDAARQNLALYTTLPFYQRLMRASGFVVEAEKAERGGGGASLSDALLDAVCLIGPAERCREKLAVFREAGVALPILLAPIGVDAALEVIRLFPR